MTCMSTELDPRVGNWYRHLDKGQLFCVVSFDEDGGLIELQHFDGDVEEIELPAWYDMTLELAEPPEDWTGPVDDIERDDLAYTETGMEAADWRKPLEEIPTTPTETWEDASAVNERDEWAEGTPVEELASTADIEERGAPAPWAEEGAGEGTPAEQEEGEAEPRK